MSCTDPQIRRSRELHDESVVITSHDHLMDHEDLLQMQPGGLDAKVTMLQADVLVFDEEGPDSVLSSLYSYEGWARRALTRIERMLQTLDAHPDRFLLVRRVGDILFAQRTGRSGVILGL